ncbi:hypothetical protein HKD37_05G012942 [Glycine soja]
MLVRVIRTRLLAMLHAKLCPGEKSSCPMASSSKPENWLHLSVYLHHCPSSKINGCPQAFVDSICVIWDPLALHPRALVHNSFFSGPGVCVKLHDYFKIILHHRLCQLCPTPPSNFGLEFCILFLR